MDIIGDNLWWAGLLAAIDAHPLAHSLRQMCIGRAFGILSGPLPWSDQ